MRVGPSCDIQQEADPDFESLIVVSHIHQIEEGSKQAIRHSAPNHNLHELHLRFPIHHVSPAFRERPVNVF